MITNTHYQNYRADIDGLRAVAVLCVVFYHLDIPGFTGGFVGVDVFFVISGYLITRNILEECQHGKWSFSRFYLRRIRRLFPALLFTIGLSFIFAFLLLSPNHFSSYAQSLLYTSALIPNVYFWQDTGYFTLWANFKPLLHLWSLGVEEHFYLIWPLILIGVITFFRRWLVLITISIVIISLSLSQYWLEVDADATFYLLPFRAFEFAIGALTLFLERKYSRSSNAENLLLLIAFTVISAVVFSYDSNTSYPGVYALVPCLATALAIFSGRATLLGKLLCNNLMVGIGLISYSFYLIHWPILVFYKYWVFRALLPGEQISIFVVSLIAAAGMYRWVEQPFRFKQNNRLTPAAFAGVSLALTFLVVLLASNVRTENGWDWRVDNWDELSSVRNQAELPEMRCYSEQIGSNCVFGAKKAGKEDILIIGDSTSQSLWLGIDDLAKKNNLKIRGWHVNGCPPLFDIQVKLHNPLFTSNCNHVIQQWSAYIRENQPGIVILSARWPTFYELRENYGMNERRNRQLLLEKVNPVYSRETSREVFTSHLAFTINEIIALGSKVILFSQAPESGINPWDCSDVPTYLINARQKEERCQFVPYNKIIERLAYTDLTIQQLARDKRQVMPVIMQHIFCDDINQSCRFIKNGAPLYKDFIHLNGAGSRYVAQQIEKEFNEFVSLP